MSEVVLMAPEPWALPLAAIATVRALAAVVLSVPLGDVDA